MEEVTIRIQVPREMEEDFKKILEEMLEEMRSRFFLSIISRSKLTKKDAILISKKIKAGIAKRHGL